jgi:hypothetical protein
MLPRPHHPKLLHIPCENSKQSDGPGLYTPAPDLPKRERTASIRAGHTLARLEAEDNIRHFGQYATWPLYISNRFDSRTTLSRGQDILFRKLRTTASFQKLRASSPASQNIRTTIDNVMESLAITKSPRRRSGWTKARIQRARDHERARSDFEPPDTSSDSERHEEAGATAFGPMRKQSAFVKEEELRCLLEDRVGTPHISELCLDDGVSAQPNVEELGMAGEVEALVGGELPLECI